MSKSTTTRKKEMKPEKVNKSKEQESDVEDLLDLDEDEEHESNDRMKALFKRSANFLSRPSALTEKEEAAIQEEAKRFSFASPSLSKKKRKLKRSQKGSPRAGSSKSFLSSKPVKEGDSDSGNEELDNIIADLDDIDRILYRDVDHPVGQKTTRSSKKAKVVEELLLLSDDEEEMAPRVATRLRSRTRSRGLRAQRKSQPEIIDIDDDSDQGVAVLPGLENGRGVIPLNDSFTDLGILLSVSVWLKGQTHNIFIYNSKTVEKLREEVATKSNNLPEFIQLFFNEKILDNNEETLAEAGLTPISSVDAFVCVKSEQQLYAEGHGSILRFKLQTSDRRGRQNCFMFLRKEERLGILRDKYAKEIDADPNSIKLMFDGDILDLNETPENCDLEGDECIDVVISNN